MQELLILVALVFGGDRMVMNNVVERHPELEEIRTARDVDAFRLGSVNVPPRTDFYWRVQKLGISYAFPDMPFIRQFFRAPIPVHYRVIFAERYFKNYYRKHLIEPKILANTRTEWVKTVKGETKKVVEIQLFFVEPTNETGTGRTGPVVDN